MSSLISIVIFSAATITLFLYGMGVAFGRRRAILAERLETYAGIEEEAAIAADAELRQLGPMQRILHVLLGRAYMQKLEDSLAQADISKELNRMLREVNLGATVDQAMLSLGRRVNSQDLDIVISAFLIQKDVGGNLTEIMEKVAETIRERLRIQGDIRVLTAQGRLSGLIVGLLPLVLFLFFMVKSPDYFQPMWGPPIWSFNLPAGFWILIGALVWQLLG